MKTNTNQVQDNVRATDDQTQGGDTSSLAIKPSKKERDAAAAANNGKTPEHKASTVDLLAKGLSESKESDGEAPNSAEKSRKPAPGADDDADPDDDDEARKPAPGADDEGAELEPVTLKKLAEQLEVDDADLYEVEIPIGNKKSMTLGALKDAFQKYEPLMERLDKVDNEEINIRVERTKTMTNIQRMVDALPAEALSPAFMQEVKAQNDAIAMREGDKILALKPEWKDRLAYQADRTDMVNTMKAYGLTDRDLSLVQDHRFVMMLADFAKMKKMNLAAESAAKKIKAAPSRRGAVETPSKGGKLSEKLAARIKAGDPSAKTQGVAQILVTALSKR